MKPDRRTQRTRKLLREALISLILEKGYDSVTVQDITDRANLGRATFYLHYHDGKDALLLDMMNDVVAEQLERIRSLPPDAPPQTPSYYAFEHAEANADFYRAILGEHGLAGVASRYRDSSAKQLQAEIESMLPPNTAVPAAIVSQFIFGALNSLIIWWLENKQPYSAKEMAEIFHRLTQFGLQGALTADMKSPEK
jgi:AcrR family transcriptional regulator